ncbi:MAG TPA: c-type cytochrome [Gemmatimonadaceae bacterium]|jgi:mono/diheme cytochrome c family protein
MTSYAVRITVLAALVVGCAKSEQAATKTDTAKPAVSSAAAPDSTARPAGDRATTTVAGPAMPAPPNSAAKGPPPSGPSTQVGVYTTEQANRGKQVYAGSCRSCHSPTSHTGQLFQDWWQNKRLSELYNFIATQMPKNDPGTLAPEDVADVVAYLLKMNDMPTGKSELYPDTDSLKKFWIDARHAK